MRFLWIFALFTALGLVGCLEPEDGTGDNRSTDNNEESDSDVLDPEELSMGGLFDQRFDVLEQACHDCAGSEAGLCLAEVLPAAPLTERQEACLRGVLASDDPYLACLDQMSTFGVECFEESEDTCADFELCWSLLVESSELCPEPAEATASAVEACLSSSAGEAVNAERLRSKEACACDQEGGRGGDFVPPQRPPLNGCFEAWTIGERGCVEAVLEEAMQDEELREGVQEGINCMNEEFMRQLACYENSECGSEAHYLCSGGYSFCGLPDCEMPQPVAQDLLDCMGCVDN